MRAKYETLENGRVRVTYLDKQTNAPRTRVFFVAEEGLVREEAPGFPPMRYGFSDQRDKVKVDDPQFLLVEVKAQVIASRQRRPLPPSAKPFDEDPDLMNVRFL